jgi:pimeloyl-ACP methyl ester carboxylesterase
MTSVTEWRAAGSFFEHKGHRNFWREAGNSNTPTLLLIHGFPTASWDWEKIWSDLVARYHVITLDMIGFGFSDKPYSYAYSIINKADIYDEFLNLRGLIHYIPERIENRERWGVGGIQKTTVPVKLIDGRVDPISGAHMVAHYRELIPNANVTELAEVGHYPQVQAPGQVLGSLPRFSG